MGSMAQLNVLSNKRTILSRIARRCTGYPTGANMEYVNCFVSGLETSYQLRKSHDIYNERNVSQFRTPSLALFEKNKILVANGSDSTRLFPIAFGTGPEVSLVRCVRNLRTATVSCVMSFRPSTRTHPEHYWTLLTYLLIYLLIYLLTYLLTPWSRVFLEN
jgi:hypothetical protein